MPEPGRNCVPYALTPALSRGERERFDVILLNPPYLEGPVRSPLDHALFDPGRRLFRRFLAEARDFLAPDGCVLMVCSSLADPARALAIAEELGWKAELLRRKRAWGETLFLHKLAPAPSRPSPPRRR